MFVRALLLRSLQITATRRRVFNPIRGLGQWKNRIARLQRWRPNVPTTKPKTQTKSATVIALLNRGKGATLGEICKATKWQTHSARAFLTGLRKKGFTIAREQRGDDGTAYRITPNSDQSAIQAAS
ncbi:DUF3489 domain-containing protein [Parasphingorhabdus sp.]|uniref:DUF3489 domain-containing protein n=1 Tax=Parasphingorhabdus sp. TaxID=2709688 RepID=UPI0032ECE94E